MIAHSNLDRNISVPFILSPKIIDYLNKTEKKDGREQMCKNKQQPRDELLIPYESHKKYHFFLAACMKTKVKL